MPAIGPAPIRSRTPASAPSTSLRRAAAVSAAGATGATPLAEAENFDVKLLIRASARDARQSARARSMRRPPPGASSMLMLRDVSTRIATTAPRASLAVPRTTGRSRKTASAMKRDEAQRDERPAPRAAAASAGCMPATRRERRQRRRGRAPTREADSRRTRRPTSSWPAIRSIGRSAGDSRPGARSLPPALRRSCSALARRARDDRRLVAIEGGVDVLAQRLPLRKVLLEGFRALVDAAPLVFFRRRAAETRSRASRARAVTASRAPRQAPVYCSRRR